MDLAKTNLCEDHSKEESTKEEESKSSSNANFRSSSDQAGVAEDEIWFIMQGSHFLSHLLIAVCRRQIPGKTKMKTAARLPSMLITALMSGISMARIMVRRNQVVAITALLTFSHLNALSSLNTKSFSKESMPSLNIDKYI